MAATELDGLDGISAEIPAERWSEVEHEAHEIDGFFLGKPEDFSEMNETNETKLSFMKWFVMELESPFKLFHVIWSGFP